MKETVVYRGIKHGATIKRLSALAVGKKINLNALTSTSISYDWANDSWFNTRNKKTMMRLELPANTSAFYIDKPLYNPSGFNEMELLVNKGYTYLLTHIEVLHDDDDLYDDDGVARTVYHFKLS